MSNIAESFPRPSLQARGSRAVAYPDVNAKGAPLVTLLGISKAFKNGVTALSRLDLAVRAGEFLSLLGPSGCGKSTALRLIAGLERQTSGSIDWAPGAKGARGRPSIGFVFQDPTLMPWAN